MTSNTTSPQIRYTAYMPYGQRARFYHFYLQDGSLVQDLEDEARASEDWSQKLRCEDVSLLKCDSLSIEPSDTRFDRVSAWLREQSESVVMEPKRPLKKYFPDGPAPEDAKKIDIIVTTKSILDGPEELYTLPEGYSFKASKERLQRATDFGNLPSPSEGVRDEIGIYECTNEESGIHAHRPAGNYGPPTALFNHALAKLKHRLEHVDQLEELEPSSDMLSSCHSLILDICKVDDDEGLREKVEQLIEKFVGDLGSRKEVDATSVDPVRFIYEFKNKGGLEGDATFQAVIVYGKILSQPKYKNYVERSNCPIILIGMMGTRLEISTAIFTDGIYVDKLLSQELCVNAWLDELVSRLGRIFKALSLSADELHEYYNMLRRNIETNTHLHPLPHTACLYPDPLPVEEGQHIPTLSYLGKISRTGRIFDFFQEDQEEVRRERPYALYLAKMEHSDLAREAEVVVKFTTHYNKRAHEILAKEGLAPYLHFCAPVVGGLHMAVMEYVKTEPLWRLPISSNDSRIYRDVETAVKLLHKENLVFGDLRVQNIMSKPRGGALLIDFDWVGEHKKDRYPASWNDLDEWADGVGRWLFMDKAHDIFMLMKVKDYIENRVDWQRIGTLRRALRNLDEP